MTHPTVRRAFAWAVVLILIACHCSVSMADPTADSEAVPSVADGATPGASEGTSQGASTSVVSRIEEHYDLWVLLPALVAIILAIFMRQVVPALAVGILVGSYMIVPFLGDADAFGQFALLAGVRVALEKYVVGAMKDQDHIMIMLFTLLIGAMVGMIAANGGTRAMVELVARRASTSRKGQLTGWLAGLVVFFDDYANTMIVGPTMRPIFDRLKISRAKLAYIVDSTAAPVASIALIGTWVGAEVGYIKQGLDAVNASGAPAFLQGIDSWTVFVQSIPYRFYAIFALLLVLLVAITGRDFGPMRKAESIALAKRTESLSKAQPGAAISSERWWLAAVPILVLVGVTVAVLWFSGLAGLEEGAAQTFKDVLGKSDPYRSILYGGLSCVVAAFLVTVLARACTIKEVADAGLDGMAKMFPAIVILVLAWSLSTVSQDLQLGEIVSGRLQEGQFAVQWLPMLVFACAAGVSFATGTSWGTMGIFCPAVVQIAATLATPLPEVEALKLFYASVGAVLAGAIFGDHCSPISDTTVLSSVASECRVEQHVWTQLPYALLAAVVAMGAGDYFCAHHQQPAWMGLLLGGGILLVFMLLIGRRPTAAGVDAATGAPGLGQGTEGRRDEGT
ncbi:MAG: Na+/H+ antiporter NhaC family protein [Planctomycetes bacterium]|nr:Na+/H+ antiporter NhaC family protein [Planctomycetota bacterium]